MDPVSMVLAVVSFVGNVLMELAPIFGITLTSGVANAIAANLLILAALTAAEFLLTSTPRAISGSELQLKLDPTQTRQIAVGTVATGGSLVYAFTWTDNDNSPNKYLVRVISLSDFPITSLVRVYDGSQFLTFGTNDRAHFYAQTTAPSSPALGDYWQNQSTTPWQWYIWNGSAWVVTGAQTPSLMSGAIYTGLAPCDQYRSTSSGNPARMWMRVHTGVTSGAVADPYLVANSPGGEWSSSMKGTGQAYVVCVYEYDTSAFPNGEPALQFWVNGAPCYDDRLSGSMSLSNPATWTFTRNAAVIAAQYLRGFTINGVTICGSTADARDLNPSMISAAANTCDTLVSAPGSTTEPQYYADLMLNSNNTVQQDLQSIVQATGGQLFDRGGIITFLPGASYTPVLTLTDTDTIWSAPKSWQPGANVSALYNAVAGNYVPASFNYQPGAYPSQFNSTYQTQDGGQRVILKLDLPAVTSDTQVQRVTSALLNQSRYQGTVSFVGPLWLLQLEQGDWFQMTSARWGFANLYFQVSQITLTQDFQVAIVANQTSPSITSWNPATQYVAPALGVSSQSRGFSLVTPSLSLTPSGSTNSAGTTIPIITALVTLAGNTPAQYFQFNMRQTSVPATIWTLPSIAALSGTNSMVVSANLLPNVSYDIQVQAVDALGRTSAWSSWITTTTTTTLTVPSSGIASSISGQGPLATSSLTASQVTNSLIPSGTGNRVILSQMEKGTTGWAFGSISGAPSPSLAVQTASGLSGIQCDFNATASGQSANTISPAGYRFAVTAGEWLAISALFSTTSLTTGQFEIEYYSSSGFLSDAAIGASIPVSSNLALREAIVQVPASAISAAVWFSTVSTAAGVVGCSMYQPMVQGVPSGQTTYPAFTPGPISTPGADVTSTNTAAAISGQGGFATANLYVQATAPTSPNNGDLWIDQSTTPYTWRVRASGVWRAGAQISYGSSAPSSPANGDIWINTTSSPYILQTYESSAWVTMATVGAVTGTNLVSGTYGTLTDANVYTSIGTAAAISGQGSLATQNTANTTGNQIWSGTYGILTDAQLVTALGVAASITGQGALATLGSVNYPNIVNGAATYAVNNSTTTYTTPSTSGWYTMQTTTITTIGSNVLCWAATESYAPYGLFGPWRILRDGSVTVCTGNFQINNTSTSPLPVILMGVDVPASGSHTYTFQVQAGSYVVTGLNINLLCAELRR